MKRPRPDLIGIDFANILRKGAKNMLEHGEEVARLRAVEDARYQYTTTHELTCLVFEERRNPPLWRIETLQPGPNGMGIVKAWEREPRFLQAELRMVLMSKLEKYGVARTSAIAREMACKMVIREMGTVRLKDSERFEGERS